jgi:LEA14-like dessication related protein
MNPLIGLLIVGAGVIILNRLSTAGTAASLHYIFDGVTAKFKDAFNIQVNVNIGIQNPTSNHFTIQSLAGDLYINDYYIGNVSNFTATLIAPNAQTPYTAAIMLSTFSLPQAVVDILQNLTNFTARLEANINVDNLSVPIKLERKGY